LLDSEQGITSSNSIQKEISDKKPFEATSAKASLPQTVKNEQLFSAAALPTLNTPPDLQPQLEKPPP